MARLALKLAGYPWDHLTPLLTGEVVPEGIDLQYDVHHGLGPVTDDPSCAGGEASLGRFLIDTARGYRQFVGLPIFPMVAFRHRCFLVKRGTAIGDLAALEGKRVGLDGWPNSGNTWTRVTLRQAGVDIWKITWVIAPIEGPVDVLVAAFMPRGFFAPDSSLVPMIPDYRAAEQAYYQQHGYVPAHHLIKLHQEVVERDPWIVKSLMTAFTASKRLWVARRRHLADTTPWLLAELAETAAIFGEDWPPYGLEPNLQMLTDFCQEQYAQKLVDAPVDPAAAFADSTRLARETPHPSPSGTGGHG